MKKSGASWITVSKEDNSDEEEKKTGGNSARAPIKKVDTSWLQKTNSEKPSENLPPNPVPKKTVAH